MNKITFINKQTGEPLPELKQGRDYIIFFGELYECEFGTSNSEIMSYGEAWKVNVEWDIKLIQ